MAVGLSLGSLYKQSLIKCYKSSPRVVGTRGTSSSRPILHIAATGLSNSYSLHGTLPVAISNTVHPKDHMSADVPNMLYVMT